MDNDSKVSILAGIEAMKEEIAAVIAAQRQVGSMQSERDNELKEVIAEHRDRMPNTTRILGTRDGETLAMSAIRVVRERDSAQQELAAMTAQRDQLVADGRRWLPRTDEALQTKRGESTVAAAKRVVKERDDAISEASALRADREIAKTEGGAREGESLCDMVRRLRQLQSEVPAKGGFVTSRLYDLWPKGDASIVEGARVLLQQLKDAQEEVAVLRGSRGNENRSLRAAYEAQRNARGKVQSVLDEVKTALDIKGGLNSDVLPRAKHVMKDRQQLQAKIDLIDGVLHPLPLGSKYWRFDASASPDASRTVDVKPMADKLKDEIDRSIFDSIKGHGADAMRYALNGASTNTDGVEDKTKVDSSTPRNGKFSAIAGVSIFNYPYLNDKWLLMMPKRGFDLFGSNKF